MKNLKVGDKVVLSAFALSVMENWTLQLVEENKKYIVEYVYPDPYIKADTIRLEGIEGAVWHEELFDRSPSE